MKVALATLIAALLPATPLVAAPERPLDLAPVLAAHGYSGFAMAAGPDAILWQTPRASCDPQNGKKVTLCHPRDPAFQRWPWASITKQMMTILTLQEVDAGRLALDTPAARYLPALGSGGITGPTIRELLQHRSGLRNPEDSNKGADGTPGWYIADGNGLEWCLGERGQPGGDWRYNNCDTVVLGAIIERTTGTSVPALFARKIAKPLALEATAFAGNEAEAGITLPDTAVPLSAAERALLTRYGPAGGLVGTPLDLLAVDRALLTGKLLSTAGRAEMWKGDPQLGFMALGQWSFEAPLEGCAKPVRLVERRGGIGRFQARNILLPDTGQSVILFTANGDFDFGEIWQGKGLSHDVLAAVACRS